MCVCLVARPRWSSRLAPHGLCRRCPAEWRASRFSAPLPRVLSWARPLPARVGFRASLFWLRDPGFLPASERAFDFEGPCRYFLRLPWPHAVLPAASHHASPLNRGLGQPEGKRQAGFWGPTADARFFPSSASLSSFSNALRSQPGALPHLCAERAGSESWPLTQILPGEQGRPWASMG